MLEMRQNKYSNANVSKANRGGNTGNGNKRNPAGRNNPSHKNNPPQDFNLDKHLRNKNAGLLSDDSDDESKCSPRRNGAGIAEFGGIGIEDECYNYADEAEKAQLKKMAMRNKDKDRAAGARKRFDEGDEYYHEGGNHGSGNGNGNGSGSSRGVSGSGNGSGNDGKTDGKYGGGATPGVGCEGRDGWWRKQKPIVVQSTKEILEKLKNEREGSKSKGKEK